MRSTSKGIRVLVVVCLCSFLSVRLVSQTITGRILGEVYDQSGAALAGATVTISDTQRATTRTVTTDATGGYLVPALPPGTYLIRVEAKGFKTVERRNVVLEVAKDADIDFTLPPGNVSETITVMGDVPLLDTTSATLGGTLSNKVINDLPLNGRNYENLLQLRPGVMRYPGGGFSTTSANGLRAEDNAYLIDGLYNSEPFSGQSIINGAGIAGDSATILPVDAIQEFNLQQNPSAEYGWKPGAIVNVGLKSGTNSLHGSAYAFGRDTALDARNFFNTVDSGPKNPRTLEQFGGTIGGPIVKDRVFFFGGYEGQRYTVGNSFVIQSPTTVSLANAGNCSFIASGDCTNSIPDAIADVHAAFLAHVIPFDVSPASLKIAGCNATGGCDGTGFPKNDGTNPNGPTSVINGFPNDVTVNNAIGKVDFHVNERNTISGMYFFGNNSGTVEDFPELQTKWLSLIHTRAQVAGGSWILVPNARWVNEARFGYNRLYQPTYVADHNTSPEATYGLNTGVVPTSLSGGLPRIGFFGEFQTLGGFKWPKLQGPDTRVQFVDHVSYTRGAHGFKFGVEVHHDGVSGGAFGNAKGSINFGGGAAWALNNGAISSSALEDFFAGAPTNASVLTGDPRRQLTNWAYALFAQDDWRATRNLTVNLGLRYELNTVLKDAHNLLGNFDPNLGLVQVGKQISSPFNGNHANFAPRIGFAWDMYGNGRTVLRGGVGLMYEAVNWETYLAFANSFGLSSVPTGAQLNGAPGPGTILVGNLAPAPATPWDNGPVFGDLSPSNLHCDDAAVGSACAIMSVDRKITTPHVWHWNLSFQHALAPNVSLELAYVGNHGTNLIGIRDINQPPVGAGWPAASIAACIASGYTDPVFCAPDSTGAEETSRPFYGKFPYLSNIFQMGNIYKSDYNGLQATLTSRNYHGLSMVLGYTYSHALDDVGANWDFGYGLGLPQDSYHPGREFASSDFDIRHRFTLSITYALPGRKSFAQLLEGWQVNSIVTLSTPQPWGPIDLGTDAAGTGSLPVSPPATSPIRWNFFGDPGDFKPSTSGIPQFPGATNPACAAKALQLDGGTVGAATAALNLHGCYAKGNSIMIPPALGTFGNMGRNTFQDTGFKNWDLSVAKAWKFSERFGAQFRAEFFNVLNHPNFANPYGGQNGFGLNDPSAPPFGCSCATPDVAAANPVIGSGGSRAIQLGLKLTF
jgi:hypothetical protein